MSSPVGSEACRRRWRGFVALVVACSVAACGPIYPPPRVRVATPSDPSQVSEPEDETGATDSTGDEEETDTTDSADADADETEPPATPAPPSPPSISASRTSAQLKNPGGRVRYRLLIPGNPVDQGEALRCYGGVREAPLAGLLRHCAG